MFFLSSGISPAFASTENPSNEILWVLNNLPPYVILRDGSVKEGVAVDFLNYAIARMPEYQHSFEKVPFTRVIGLMKDGEFACNPLLLKLPEREAYIEYSLPIIMALPHHVIINADDADKFKPYQDSEGKIELGKLLSDTELTVSVSKDRGYPPAISKELIKAQNYSHVMYDSTDFGAPIHQLNAGWVDYIISYPFEMSWYLEKDFKDKSFLYLPIVNVPEYALAYVGCTKGAQGTQVISRINDIIREAGRRPSWHLYQEKYLDDNARVRLNALLQHYQPFDLLKDTDYD